MERTWTFVGVETFKKKDYLKFKRTDAEAFNPDGSQNGPQFFNLSKDQVSAIMDVDPNQLFAFVDGTKTA
jgi:hypothetical protein